MPHLQQYAVKFLLKEQSHNHIFLQVVHNTANYFQSKLVRYDYSAQGLYAEMRKILQVAQVLFAAVEFRNTRCDTEIRASLLS